MFYKKLLAKILFASAIIIITLSFSSLFLSDKSFILDLFSHYQLQYFILLSIISIYLLFSKKLFLALIVLLYLPLIGIFIYPAQFSEKPLNADIFYMNTYYYNDNHEIIINEILKKSPESVFLVETNEKLTQRLIPFYGNPIIEINDKANSFTFFSKHKTKNPIIHNETMPKFISIEFPDFTLIGIHAMDPLTPEKRQLNLIYFNEIQKFINNLENRNFILVGDFNNTYFSKTFRNHFKDYFNKNIYSWSTNRPWILPIDHALSNFKILVSPTRKLSSDHKGLIISIPQDNPGF